MIAVQSLKESVSSDGLSGICNVESGLSNNCKNNRTVSKRGDDDLVYGLSDRSAGTLLGDELCVDECGKEGCFTGEERACSVRRERKG